MKNKNVEEIFKILRDFYKEKERKLELDFDSVYTLLIATMLSAQTTDKNVNKATTILFKVVNNPKDMILLGEEKLKQYIKTINYFNNKAKNIIKTSQQIIEEFNSLVPDNIEDLVKLAGVGRKTASCVLSYGFKKKAIAVDTHVFRVSNRLGIVKEESVNKVEKNLLDIVPDEYILEVNQNFVLLGRYICKARNPKCEECPLKNLCKYYRNK